MFKNSEDRYGWISILFHWVSFLLISFLLVEGLYMVTLTYYDPYYHTLPQWHKVIGFIVGALTFARLLWRYYSPSPKLLTQHPWEILAAKTAHFTLYLFIILMTLTGYLITTGNGEPLRLSDEFIVLAITTLDETELLMMGNLHKWLAYGFILTILIHTAASLKHHYHRKDATLTRMLFTGCKKRSE